MMDWPPGDQSDTTERQENTDDETGDSNPYTPDNLGEYTVGGGKRQDLYASLGVSALRYLGAEPGDTIRVHEADGGVFVEVVDDD